MAIDSAAKRKSVAGISLYVGMSIEPNASKPQGWRQTSGYGYFGINADAPPTDVFGPELKRRRQFISTPGRLM